MYTSPSERSVVVAAKDQVSCDAAGEVVMLHLESGRYFGLDGVGARVWSLIQRPRRVSDILKVLLEEYEVERERCMRDLLALLRELAEKGLIQVRGEGSA